MMDESKQPLSRDNKSKLIWLSEKVLKRSESLLHIIGYIFLAFAIVDCLFLLVPPQFTNALWEFQTIGQLVERSPVPLIGLVFIFYRPEPAINIWELRLLKLLSWLCLLVGICYLMMLPLGIANTFRLHRANTLQLNARISQQQEQLQQRQNQLDRLTEDQLQNIFNSAIRQDNAPNIETPEQLREQAIGQLQLTQENLNTQAELTRINLTTTLTKTSIKTNLGAIFSGIAFISIWHLTRWARKLRIRY
ncbi:HpsJ-like protein, cyanoexosortase A-associated [Roseofilum casamattae]|uniref:HpsJ family protein n=1 Tax=Roseofilum casamattae BLCC-M143 TaxID=3022442 RepID=A0ABT7BZP4_9CYAN|nr:HpsJ family protein [Roseofilum casamattae]MDJ1184682.1 HpsJ family protein [Roseofilum casamattae BLCC-M143]